MQNILVTGGEQLDRIKYATSFAGELLCPESAKLGFCRECVCCRRVLSNSHPNLVYIEPENKESLEENNNDSSLGTIKIEQIRPIILENQKSNFEKGLAIFIITHMHRATNSAANALLKVLEENNQNKLFIALAPSRTAVLKTIASRLVCRIVKPKKLKTSSCSNELREKIFHISKTLPKNRFDYCRQFNVEREKLLKELDRLLECLSVLLMNNEVPPRLALTIFEALIDAQSHLKKNLNPRLVVDQLVFRRWPFFSQ